MIEIKDRLEEEPDCVAFSVRHSKTDLMVGCHNESEGKLWIWIAVSAMPGGLKEMLNEATSFFCATRIEFTQVINANLLTKLRGFRLIRRRHPKGFYQLDLVGEWKP